MTIILTLDEWLEQEHPLLDKFAVEYRARNVSEPGAWPMRQSAAEWDEWFIYWHNDADAPLPE